VAGAERTVFPLWPLALLAALAALGLAAEALDLLEARAALHWARGHATQWWFGPALVLLQVLLFTFALPGSAVLWLAAPLFAPATATVILTAGGCGGALAAYAFARGLTGGSLARLRASRGFRLLQQEGGFLTLCALRLAPGFPHSVINYAAGTLRLPLPAFLASAAIGFSVKTWLYSSAIDAALDAGRPADLLGARTLGPLVAAAAVALAARAWVGRRRAMKR
jgi:uncharacterized membrane protein YdjX (TVP38/TMEM64 family)